MTPAERQKRRRDRVRKEKAKLAKEAARAEKQAKNAAKYDRWQEQQAPIRTAIRARLEAEWENTPAQPPLATIEDELAQQVLDVLKIEGIAFEAFQEALHRRAGRN